MLGRIYAGNLGFVAFVTVLIRGLLTNGSAESTLWAASLAMFLFAALGYVAGQVAAATVAESVRRQLFDQLQSEDSATAGRRENA